MHKALICIYSKRRGENEAAYLKILLHKVFQPSPHLWVDFDKSLGPNSSSKDWSLLSIIFPHLPFGSSPITFELHLISSIGRGQVLIQLNPKCMTLQGIRICFFVQSTYRQTGTCFWWNKGHWNQLVIQMNRWTFVCSVSRSAN